MSKYRKFLSLLLSLMMLVMALPLEAITVSAENTTEFLGGDGTEENPYLISNKIHLNNVRNYLDAHFKMVANIEFAEADFADGGMFYNGGQGWEPIGVNKEQPFVGTFNGNDHTITGLYCNRIETQYTGLFGYNKGAIRTLGLESGSVSASDSSSGEYVYTGGIVGYNEGAISSCYNAGSVSAPFAFSDTYAYVGGIAGRNNGTISNCYNTGNVSASTYRAYTGGITGYNSEMIGNCYNIGRVFAASVYAYAGGIAGYNSGITKYNNTISNCYNTGSVSVSNYYSGSDFYAFTGGIVGYRDLYGVIRNCYYLNTSSKGVGSGKDTTTILTIEQMEQPSAFIGFDFDTVWEFVEENPYHSADFAEPHLLCSG